MNRQIVSIASTLQSAYDEQYSDATTGWRECGGKYKADNILRVCAGRSFSKVLECGAGEGSILKFLDARGAFAQLYAVEISKSGIAQIQKRNLATLAEVKKFDGYEIPYPDKYFDMAYCSHVIEHVEHPRIILREIRRVSNYQVFEIPLDYSPNVDEAIEYYLAYGHINIYTPSLFKFLLKTEGYEVLRERFSHLASEVLRYVPDGEGKHKPSIIREMMIRGRPLRNGIKRALYGRKRYREYGFSAYTCLTRNVGELKIF
ncbi:MAG: class I SAM-dependent methyltransferase [Gaiellaceae bacterium]